jgi:fluoride exporter
MTALYVAVAGGLGSMSRYLIGLASVRWFGDRFPVGTLLVNLIGCLLIGLAVAVLDTRQLDPRARAAIIGGFIGGFTTYSAFAFETLALAERRGAGWAVLYVAASLVGGLAACAIGVLIARRLS